MVIMRRRYDPLGIVIAHDDGLAQVIPGGKSETVVSGERFTSVSYYDGLAIAAAPEKGVWVHNMKNWQQVWEGNARTVAAIGTGDLFIATADGKLLKSADRGVEWEELESAAALIKHGQRMVPMAGESRPFVTGVVQSDQGIVISVGGGGCWYTRDKGNTWLKHSDGLDAKTHGIWAHPEKKERLFATADSGVFRSEDEGYSWLQSQGGLDRAWGGSMAVLSGAPDTLVVSMARHAPGVDGAVFRSANGGATWTRVSLEGEDEWDRVPCVERPWDWEDVVFISAGTRLFASHDKGRNWIGLSDGLPVANAIAASL